MYNEKQNIFGSILLGSFIMVGVAGGLTYADGFLSNTKTAEEKVVVQAEKNIDKIKIAEARQRQVASINKIAESIEPMEIITPPEPEVRGYVFQRENIFKNTVRAESYLVGDLDTGEILFRKNDDATYPIASISKFITAIVSLETLDQGEITEISREALETEGHRGQFKMGEKIKIGSLLYPLLIVSSNDAAEALARTRDRDEFIYRMKSKVDSYGLRNTNFGDPSGLSRENYSTASDLFKLMRIVRSDYPEIIEISRLETLDLDEHHWENINQAIDLEGFMGGKTGYTNAAKKTSIGYYRVKLANEAERNIGVVILQSETREDDTKNMLDYLRKYSAFIE